MNEPQKEMTAKWKRKALTLVSNGRKLIAPLLLHPTRAAKHFHPGLKLLSDWDKFHLKPLPDAPKEKRRQVSALPPTSSPSKRTKGITAEEKAEEMLKSAKAAHREIEKTHLAIISTHDSEMKVARNANENLMTNVEALRTNADQAEGDIRALEDQLQVSPSNSKRNSLPLCVNTGLSGERGKGEKEKH